MCGVLSGRYRSYSKDHTGAHAAKISMNIDCASQCGIA